MRVEEAPAVVAAASVSQVAAGQLVREAVGLAGLCCLGWYSVSYAVELVAPGPAAAVPVAAPAAALAAVLAADPVVDLAADPAACWLAGA